VVRLASYAVVSCSQFTMRAEIASMAFPQTLSWSSDGKPLKSRNVRGASAIVFVDCDNSSKDSRIQKWEKVNEMLVFRGRELLRS
jgi:hypothetical protein